MRGDDGPARVADGVPEERIGDVREVDDHPEPMHLVDDRPSDVGEPLAVTVVPRGAADRARDGPGEGHVAGPELVEATEMREQLALPPGEQCVRAFHAE